MVRLRYQAESIKKSMPHSIRFPFYPHQSEVLQEIEKGCLIYEVIKIVGHTAAPHSQCRKQEKGQDKHRLPGTAAYNVLKVLFHGSLLSHRRSNTFFRRKESDNQ